MGPDVLVFMIPLVAIGLGLMIPIVAILVKPLTDGMRQRERAEARRMYERLATEKLEVIKTALAMGYSNEELRDLDARLEKLIGAERLKTLLDAKQPLAPELAAELRDTDLEAEIQRLRVGREGQRSG